MHRTLREKVYLLFLAVALLCASTAAVAQEKSQVDKAAIEKLAASLAAAKTDEERNALLEANKELVTVQMQRALVREGGQLLSRGEYSQALSLFQLAQSISENIDDKAGKATALIGIGNIYFLQGGYEKALENYSRSLILREELNDKIGITNSLSGIGNIYYLQGDYDQALDFYRKSLRISEELKDKVGIARILGNTANIYCLQGNYTNAKDSYQEALSIYKELNNKAGISSMLGNIGEVYRLQGNYGLALIYSQNSLTLEEESNNKLGIAGVMSNIGNIYVLQRNYLQSMEYYRKSLATYEELKGKNGIARVLKNMGEIYRLQDNYGQALEEYNRSLKLREELKDKDGIARTLVSIGDMYRLQRNYEKALEYLQKSLILREQLKDKAGTAETLNSIAKVYKEQGNYEKTLEIANQSSDLSKQVGNTEYYWRNRFIVGIAYRYFNRIDQSRQAFEESINAIESIRYQVAGDELAQQSFFEDKTDPYYEMVGLLIDHNNFVEALSYAERVKARAVLDVFQSSKVEITRTMTAQERKQESALKSMLISLNNQIFREKQREQSDKLRISDLENKLEKVRLNIESFRTNLYATHPELKSKRVEVQPVTLAEAHELLPDPQSALLEFVVAEEKTHLFVITSQGKVADLKVYMIDVKPKDLAERVSKFRNMLADKELGFRKPGRELYDLLLKPAQEQLVGKSTLVIVPEGPLWELPFQVLQTPKNRYLLQDYTLFYTPSLTALREMSKPRKDAQQSNRTLLAFGNPTLGKQTVERIKSTLLDADLLPLPAAEEQVKQLAKLYGPKQSKIYIGPDAREEQVKAEAGNYRILQFATHGILNNASPMYSHLVLSQTDEKGGEDGLLEAWEIAQMDLKADMAVLAACETARGRIGAGEGVIGLTWALFVAGCPTTVVSQWKVEDEATKELMLEFHRLLKLKQQTSRSRMAKAQALRLAALKLMRTGRNPHPFYWAGFVMVGNGR